MNETDERRFLEYVEILRRAWDLTAPGTSVVAELRKDRAGHPDLDASGARPDLRVIE